MAFKAPLIKSKTDYKQVPSGSHVARIFQLIDLGVQITPFKDEDGNTKKTRYIMLRFEIPEQLLDDGSPMVKEKEFSLSVGQKSNLRKFIQELLGIKLSDEEACDFDLESLLGKTAIISVAHVPYKKDPNKKYAFITGAMPLLAGMEVPDAINKPLIFSTTEFKKEIFDLLPEWIQKRIVLPSGIDFSTNDENDPAALLA